MRTTVQSGAAGMRSLSSPYSGDAGLVPLTERVRSLQACRLVLAVASVAAYPLVPALQDEPLAKSVALAVVYLLATSVTLVVRGVRRAWVISLVGAALMVDGLFLALVTYAVAGFDNALVGLLMLHVVAVTLLSSFRTGLKTALWHTLVMFSVHELANQEEGGIARFPGLPESSGEQVGAAVGVLWLCALTTASFAAVNERELRRRNFDLVALAGLSLRLERSMSPRDVGDALIAAVTEDHGVRRAVLVGVRKNELVRFAGHEDTAVPHPAKPAADRMVQQAIAEHRTLRVPRLDPTKDPWLASVLPGARNLLLVPLYAEGTVVGMLVAEHGTHRGSRVERRVVAMLERYASHAALALSNANLMLRVRELADTDGLTGVANRRTFDESLVAALARAERDGTVVSLAMVDVDHFKKLNDTYGHQVGDVTLQRVARALQQASRDGDLVARYGGEEFAVVLPVTSPEDATVLGERLRRAIADSGTDPDVTASIGMSTFPLHALTPGDLVVAADRALYRSKEGGRNRVSLASVEDLAAEAATDAATEAATEAVAGPTG